MKEKPAPADLSKSRSAWLIVCMGAAGLASCGVHQDRMDRVKVPVVRHAAGSEIKVKAHLFTAPDDFAFVKGQDKPGVAGTYTGEEGGKLADSLARRRGFELLLNPPVATVTKSGQSGEVKLTREFIYPTEYEPPVLGKVIGDGIHSVTPATPTRFAKKDLGVVLKYRAKRTGNGMIDVVLNLERGCFLGFVNYGSPITGKHKGLFGREVDVVLSENRIEMPVFDVKRFNSRVKVRDGDFLAVGGMMPSKAPEDSRFQPWKSGAPGSVGRNFVALIQVGSATAK